MVGTPCSFGAATSFLAGPSERLSLAEERQARYGRSHPDAAGRAWIRDGLAELNASGVVAPLLDPDREPMRWLELSDDAAQDLISFWRTRRKGEVVFDFTDPGLDTSFLGILYQDLSEQQKSRYALLETPDFIADFILATPSNPPSRSSVSMNCGLSIRCAVPGRSYSRPFDGSCDTADALRGRRMRHLK